jgi:hypothetical protein
MTSEKRRRGVKVAGVSPDGVWRGLSPTAPASCGGQAPPTPAALMSGEWCGIL